MRYLIFTLTFLALSPACQNKQQSTSKKLHKEIMRIHDEVMPRMGEVARLQKELRRHQDRLIRDTSDAGPIQLKKVEDHLLALNKGEKAMWDWMHEFNEVSEDKMKPDAYLKRLQEEKVKVIEMRDLIQNAIQWSEQSLKQINRVEAIQKGHP